MDDLVSFLQRRGKLEEAEPILRECLRLREQRYGEENRRTLMDMNVLANLLWRTEKLDEVEALNRRNLEIRQRSQGREHPDTLWAMTNLALVLRKEGKLEEADALSKECLEIRANGANAIADSVPAEGDGTVLARDNFDGTLTLDWKILDPDPTHTSLAKNPGTLTITAKNGGNVFLLSPPIRAAKDFEITTCISSFEPSDAYHQAGLIVYDGSDNYVKFVYQYGGGPGGRTLTVGVAHQAEPTHVYFRTPRELSRIWLRIAKQGNIYKFSTSLDGKEFLPAVEPVIDRTGLFQGFVKWGDGAPEHVGLWALTGSEEAPEVDASFDFFEIRALSGIWEQAGEKSLVHSERADDGNSR
jgi:hypothetical protein